MATIQEPQASSFDAHKREVPGEFNRIAKRYDLLTALNPGYKKHLRWSAQRLGQRPGAKLLDLCCGTGLSTEALVQIYPDALVDAVDGSAQMLAHARAKKWPATVRFLEADANDLDSCDLADDYDAILMAYGIRNLTDPDRALRSLHARLRPGGTICFHEYSVADSKRSQAIWSLVSAAIIIPSGWMTSPGSNIYRYLRDSVRNFDGVQAFEARLRQHGFVNVRTEAMDGWQKGIVHSFLASRASMEEVQS